MTVTRRGLARPPRDSDDVPDADPVPTDHGDLSWRWPQPMGRGVRSLLLTGHLAYAMFVSLGSPLATGGRPLWIAPFLPWIANLAALVVLPALVPGVGGLTEGAALAAGRRWYSLGLLVTAVLHAATIPPGGTAIVDLAVCSAIAASTLTTLIAHVTTRTTSTSAGGLFAFSAVAGALGGGCIASLAWGHVGLAAGPTAASIGLGVVIALLRPLGAIRAATLDVALWRGPLDPVLWWTLPETAARVGRVLLEQPLLARLTLARPFISGPPLATRTPAGRLLRDALRASPILTEALVPLVARGHRNAGSAADLVARRLHAPPLPLLPPTSAPEGRLARLAARGSLSDGALVAARHVWASAAHECEPLFAPVWSAARAGERTGGRSGVREARQAIDELVARTAPERPPSALGVVAAAGGGFLVHAVALAVIWYWFVSPLTGP